MKKTVLSLVLSLLILVLVGCDLLPPASPAGTAAPTETPFDEFLSTATPAPDLPALDLPAPTASPAHAAIYGVDESAALLSRAIDGSCFDVSLSGWDTVRFCCVAPADGSGEDVRFYLVDPSSSCILFTFPETSPGNLLSGVAFDRILSVNFRDIDADSRDDIIVHLSYRYPRGTVYNSVVIFSQRDGADDFVHDKFSSPNLAAYLIRNGRVGSLDDILSGIDAYWDYLPQYQRETLEELLSAVLDGVRPGTAGCSLRAVQYACSLLDFAASSSMSTDAARDVTASYMASLSSEPQALLVSSLSSVEEARADLQDGDNASLLESIGLTPADFPYGTEQYPLISAVMSAVGVA